MSQETTTETRDFYVTFGQKYADHRLEHPTFPAAHPDGWLRITAATYGEARNYAFDLLGPKFAFIYSERTFSEYKHLHQLGELAHHTVDAQPTHEPTC